MTTSGYLVRVSPEPITTTEDGLVAALPRPLTRKEPDMHRRRVLIALALTASVLVMMSGVAEASPSHEHLYASINSERTARGLGALARDPLAQSAAQAQADRMAAQGRMYHSTNLAGSFPRRSWVKLGENVGFGPEVGSIHVALTRSAAHMANMLGDYDKVGVGVAQADGRTYVSEVFVKSSTKATKWKRTAKRRARR